MTCLRLEEHVRSPSRIHVVTGPPHQANVEQFAYCEWRYSFSTMVLGCLSLLLQEDFETTAAHMKILLSKKKVTV